MRARVALNSASLDNDLEGGKCVNLTLGPLLVPISSYFLSYFQRCLEPFLSL